MARGKQREHWGHTSVLLAKLHNCHIGKSHQARKPEEFNPIAIAERRESWRPATRSDVQRIKELAPDRQAWFRRGE